MSYTRSYTRTITVHYSGSISYPKSETGGVKHYSGTVSEDVNITINVDTSPYDRAVSNCDKAVGLLTGAVVATEGAQVMAINNNASKIGNTIIQGFFRTVGSEISQQIAELESQIAATLTHLKEMRRRCIEKQEQMGRDYERLLERYGKLFADLDRELQVRIVNLDKAVFKTKETLGESVDRLIGDDINRVSVLGKEEAQLYSAMGVSNIKALTRQALAVIQKFLADNRRNDRLLQTSKIEGHPGDRQYCPALYIEAEGPQAQIHRRTYAPEALIKGKSVTQIEQQAKSAKFAPLTDEAKQKIDLYINEEMSRRVSGTDPHTQRVRECMQRMIDLDALNA